MTTEQKKDAIVKHYNEILNSKGRVHYHYHPSDSDEYNNRLIYEGCHNDSPAYIGDLFGNQDENLDVFEMLAHGSNEEDAVNKEYDSQHNHSKSP
jgi:hypothetical protein